MLGDSHNSLQWPFLMATTRSRPPPSPPLIQLPDPLWRRTERCAGMDSRSADRRQDQPVRCSSNVFAQASLGPQVSSLPVTPLLSPLSSLSPLPLFPLRRRGDDHLAYVSTSESSPDSPLLRLLLRIPASPRPCRCLGRLPGLTAWGPRYSVTTVSGNHVLHATPGAIAVIPPHPPLASDHSSPLSL